MNGDWMVASALVGLLLAIAATAFAGVASMYRRLPLRWIRAAGIVTTLAISAALLRPGPPAAERARAGPIVAAPLRTAVTQTDRRRPPLREPRVIGPFEPTRSLAIPALPPGIDRGLHVLWLAGSTGLLFAMLAAAARLAVERRRWSAVVVGGMPAMVSPAFGPAVVGVLRPTIVVPRWVLALDEPAQRAIMRHEAEHRAAADTLLQLTGLATLVLMPWNIGLWMQWRELRRSIELDCDARVVNGGVERADYAAVLLDAWRRSRGSWLAATAFAERASGLGARVEHLLRPQPRRRSIRTTTGTLATGALVALACAVPAPRRANAVEGPYPLVVIDGVRRPDLPPQFRFVGSVTADTITRPGFEIRYRGNVVQDTMAAKRYPRGDTLAESQFIPAPASQAHFGAEARYGAQLYYTKRYREGGGRMLVPNEGDRFVRAAAPNTSRQQIVDRVFNDLFGGIALTPDQRARAHDILRLENEAQGQLRGPVLAIWPKRIALSETRNAGLRELVTGADREKLEARIEARTYRPITLDQIESGTYSSYLDGITLGVQEQATARRAVRSLLLSELKAYDQDPNDAVTRSTLRTALLSDLRALIETEADRVRFDARVAKMQEIEARPR